MRSSKRLFLVLGGVLLAATAWGAHGSHWVVESSDDFAKGELQGVALEADGGIGPAPALHEIGRLEGDALLLGLAAAPDGSWIAAAGFEGRIYRLKEGAKPEEIGRVPEAAAFAVAVGPNGEIFAAGSPDGKVYRFPGAGKDPQLVVETGATYVWAMKTERGGTILAATGSPGRLLRIDPKKKTSETLLEVSDANVVSLAVDAEGTAWCGTDGEAVVYRVAHGEKPVVVAESNREQIAAIAPGRDGSLWILGSSGPSTRQTKPPTTSKAKDQGQQSGGDSGTPEGTVTVTVVDESGGGVPPPTASSSRGASFELLERRADGVVVPIVEGHDEIGYDLLADADGKVWLTAGPNGRIYRVDGHSLAMVRDLPEKNPIFLLPGPKGSMVTATADGPALYRVGPGGDPTATYLSEVRIEARRSRWGAFHWEGRPGSGRIRIYFRSGGVVVPDATWSDWQEVEEAEGQIPSPMGRYLQWKAVLESRGQDAPRLRRVETWAVAGNLPPRVTDFQALDPGVIFVRGAYGSGNVVVEAANPDQLGMFTVVGDAQERSSRGKQMFRKGFRTLTWKQSDPDDDALLADVDFRPAGRGGVGVGDWMRVARDLDEPLFSFDATGLPDGLYLFRVTVSDRKGVAPEDALSDEATTTPVVIDDTPPSVTIETHPDGKDGVRVQAKYLDVLSPMLRAEYSVDAGPWVQVAPVDGIPDEKIEEIDFVARGEHGIPKYVILRVLDQSFNVTTRSCLEH